MAERRSRSQFVAYCEHCDAFIGVRTYRFRQFCAGNHETAYSVESTTKFTPHKDDTGRWCPNSGISIGPEAVMTR